MVMPNLLAEDINKLKRVGYDIEIIDESEITNEPKIGIIVKSFPIPKNIWNNDKVDLLVVAFPSYPNSKMDMFWVTPDISLINGSIPKATSAETKFEKPWQRFSWHVNSWNPAHDNLITYLDVVRDRFNRSE